MLKDLGSIAELLTVAATLTVVGCSSSSSKEGGCPATPADAGSAEAGCPAAKEAGCPASEAGCPASSAQMPPQGAANVNAWLATGSYKQWKCEPAVHASRSPSPHGFNRICSNMLISENVGASTPWPKGAAAVKELYTSATDTTPMGYSLYLKTADDSAGGANWYWFDRDSSGVQADGLGTTGTPKDVCVGCHGGAGSDANHTPTPGSHDLVYTPVH